MDTTQSLPARLGPEDLAATACLDFPEMFAAVRVGSTVDALRNFLLYKAGAGREPCFDTAHTEATKAFLGRWFLARHRTAVCEIFIKRRGPERHFEITHGTAPVTRDLIDESLARRIVTQVSTQRSYAIYNEDTRLLAVHALEFIKNGLRTSFGHGFAGDSEYFAKTAYIELGFGAASRDPIAKRRRRSRAGRLPRRRAEPGEARGHGAAYALLAHRDREALRADVWVA